MTEKPLHAVSLATDSGVDSKSLTHHAKNAEDILSKIPHELQKLIQLHLSAGGSDRVREETNLRKRINEHLDYVINLFGHIQEEKDAREMELQKVRDEFRGIIQRFERLSHYCLAKLPTVVQKEHENVAATLVKLRWHISQAEEEHGLLSTRVHTLEAFNHKLDSDIKRLSGCTSLANEKFVIERTEMERIALETEEARKLLTESTAQLKNAEFRHQLAVDRSVKVREELATELALIEFHRKEAKQVV
ncbi:hypothetical protein FGIG_07631 [Fasciola gigantica]|uniref:Uncharacterized protein n=1 Tax=Fasciola gigantica TaxID=46835 RepID=A0A504Y7S2_FASGI|nr:hypothetical protein FGIG_07631 [Fasciola gigantica]